MCRHCEKRPVWEEKVRVPSELLDEAEDIVPPSKVERRNVTLELVEDLVHFECGEDVLDEDCAFHAVRREPEDLLRHDGGIARAVRNVGDAGFRVLIEDAVGRCPGAAVGAAP